MRPSHLHPPWLSFKGRKVKNTTQELQNGTNESNHYRYNKKIRISTVGGMTLGSRPDRQTWWIELSQNINQKGPVALIGLLTTLPVLQFRHLWHTSVLKPINAIKVFIKSFIITDPPKQRNFRNVIHKAQLDRQNRVPSLLNSPKGQLADLANCHQAHAKTAARHPSHWQLPPDCSWKGPSHFESMRHQWQYLALSQMP